MKLHASIGLITGSFFHSFIYSFVQCFYKERKSVKELLNDNHHTFLFHGYDSEKEVRAS